MKEDFMNRKDYTAFPPKRKTSKWMLVAGIMMFVVGFGTVVYNFSQNSKTIHPSMNGQGVYIEAAGFTINDGLSDEETRQLLEELLVMRK